MSPSLWLNVFIASGSLIVTLIGCTAAIIVFLWKKFDAVYTQIEEINLSQKMDHVKNESRTRRIEDYAKNISKEIESAILKHEVNEHGRT